MRSRSPDMTSKSQTDDSDIEVSVESRVERVYPPRTKFAEIKMGHYIREHLAMRRQPEEVA